MSSASWGVSTNILWCVPHTGYHPLLCQIPPHLINAIGHSPYQSNRTLIVILGELGGVDEYSLVRPSQGLPFPFLGKLGASTNILSCVPHTAFPQSLPAPPISYNCIGILTVSKQWNTHRCPWRSGGLRLIFSCVTLIQLSFPLLCQAPA